MSSGEHCISVQDEKEEGDPCQAHTRQICRLVEKEVVVFLILHLFLCFCDDLTRQKTTKSLLALPNRRRRRRRREPFRQWFFSLHRLPRSTDSCYVLLFFLSQASHLHNCHCPTPSRKEKGISVYKRNAIRSLSVRCHDSVTLSSDLAAWISCTTTNVLSVLSVHVDPFHVPNASSRDNRQLVRCGCPASFQQHAALLCT